LVVNSLMMNENVETYRSVDYTKRLL
jgi:hypothetical protein